MGLVKLFLSETLRLERRQWASLWLSITVSTENI